MFFLCIISRRSIFVVNERHQSLLKQPTRSDSNYMMDLEQALEILGPIVTFLIKLVRKLTGASDYWEYGLELAAALLFWIALTMLRARVAGNNNVVP